MAPLKSAQQEKFVTEWVAGRSQSDAYRAAYPRSQKWKPEAVWARASELAKDGKVFIRYRELMDEAAKLAVIDRAWVMRHLQTIVERCMQEQPVILAGMPTGEYTFQASGANRALELLGKDLGMFVDRKEITGKDGEPLTSGPVDNLALARAILAILATAKIVDAPVNGGAGVSIGTGDAVLSSTASPEPGNADDAWHEKAPGSSFPADLPSDGRTR